MDSRWKRKALSRWSSVLCVMHLPSSHKKSIPSLLMVPIVSAAIETNKYDRLSEEYLFLYLFIIIIFLTLCSCIAALWHVISFVLLLLLLLLLLYVPNGV